MRRSSNKPLSHHFLSLVLFLSLLSLSPLGYALMRSKPYTRLESLHSVGGALSKFNPFQSTHPSILSVPNGCWPRFRSRLKYSEGECRESRWKSAWKVFDNVKTLVDCEIDCPF